MRRAREQRERGLGLGRRRDVVGRDLFHEPRRSGGFAIRRHPTNRRRARRFQIARAVAQRAQTVERGRREVVGRGVGGRRDARARGVGERHRAMGADDARCAETRPENLSGKSDDELRRGSRTA